jgi:hypothetical protein
MKQIIKSVLARTPYRIIRDQAGNRFQAIDADEEAWIRS